MESLMPNPEGVRVLSSAVNSTLAHVDPWIHMEEDHHWMWWVGWRARTASGRATTPRHSPQHTVPHAHVSCVLVHVLLPLPIYLPTSPFSFPWVHAWIARYNQMGTCGGTTLVCVCVAWPTVAFPLLSPLLPPLPYPIPFRPSPISSSPHGPLSQGGIDTPVLFMLLCVSAHVQ